VRSSLAFSHLGYSYPGAGEPALSGVDLVLDSGAALITGPSGGGKSTLLRVCNGLVPHFHGGVISGRAQVMGHEVATTPTRELAREVGFLFQDPERQAVYATVERDVAFGLENLAVPRQEMRRRIDEALWTCGIGHLRGRAVTSLSGGERQRLALAGVLAMHPRLLVLDEPFAQLDAEGSLALREALGAALREGAGLLVAEHRDAGLGLAGHLLHIEGGRLAEAPARSERETAPSPWWPRSPIPSDPSRSGGAVWHLRRVTAGHGRTAVLHDVDLAAGGGEVMVLSGANGSGKTTLLRTIAGLLPPLAGGVDRRPGRIAYLPQNPSALLHRPTVRQEVAWTLRRSGVPELPDGVLEELGIAAIADRYPGDLSAGQRQRAALASIIVGNPILALLDEPTRGMDAPSRQAIIGAVRRIAAAGTCVVLATHDRSLAAGVASRFVEVREGSSRELRPMEAVPC
jgi:energy-coupling factor transporter ATP-binding protein EcfA2